MNIQLNGKPATVAAAVTVGDLVRKKDLDPSAVVVEHNRTILTATDLDRTPLKEDDVLEILTFVGGG
jgi:thiamine biosynthesis protein ThiS